MAANRPVVVAGVRIGRWTVQDEFIKTAKGEKKWLCRCDCGTERYVLERSLRHGGSMSCGCIRKEEAVKAISYDLAGQVFGDLTVLSKAENQRKNGGIWWTCQCSCGNLYDVPGSLLVTGRRTHCGSKAHPKNYASVDISNQRFHRLVALYPLKNRDPKGAVLWRCKCDCGNEADVSYNNLVYGNMKSCGCQKKEHDMELAPIPGETMTLAEIGHQLDALNKRFQMLLSKAAEDGSEPYTEQFKAIVEETTALKDRKRAIETLRKENAEANHHISMAVATMQNASAELTQWDEPTIRQLVDTVKVISADEIIVYLRGSVEIRQEIIQ